MRQSRPVGTAQHRERCISCLFRLRAVRRRCLPGRSPRRGDPRFPGSVVTHPLPSVDSVIFCSKSLFLAGALLFLGLATSVQAQFTYTINNATITITGYTGTNEAVLIPSTIDGLSVSDIATNAFDSDALTSVVIPDSVTNIGDQAFYDCSGLTNVTFGDSVTRIGNYAFSGLRGGGISGDPTYPSGSPLTTVTIPTSVTNIGVGAFEGCANLTAISVAPGNSAYSSVAGVLFNQNQTTLVEYPGGLGGSYAIPAGVTTIESNAFYYSSGLASVTIPNSVISIGDSAFYECQALTNVTMAEGLASIGAFAFGGGLVMSLVVPTIQGCPLTSITIPSSVTNIGPGAFAGCHSLTNVTIPNSVTSIEDYTFEVCYMTSLTIPDSVTNIGNRAFFLCQGLTSVTIPASVTSIGDNAFESCYGLTNAYFLGNAPSTDSTVFAYDSLTAYYLPGTIGWPEFATNTGVPTALWTLPYPLVLNGTSGVQADQFGFTISWAANVPVVVEASTDLSKPIWTPIATNTLSGGISYFSDPQLTNFPARFYRLREQ